MGWEQGYHGSFLHVGTQNVYLLEGQFHSKPLRTIPAGIVKATPRL